MSDARVNHLAKTTVTVGSKYRITGGRYKDRLCKVVATNSNTYFAVVRLLDAWGKETKEQDAVPQSFLEK